MSGGVWERRVAGILFWVLFALVMLAQVAIVAPEFWMTRLWEDEAFNLTVPLNLLAGHGYSSAGLLGSGTITPFDASSRRFGAPLADKWRADTAAFAMLNGTLVRLTSDGQAVNAQTGTAMPGLAQYHFTDLVNVPMYDAFEVNR